MASRQVFTSRLRGRPLLDDEQTASGRIRAESPENRMRAGTATPQALAKNQTPIPVR